MKNLNKIKEVKREIKINFKTKIMEANILNMWNVAKAVLKVKFIVVNANIKKKTQTF